MAGFGTIPDGVVAVAENLFLGNTLLGSILLHSDGGTTYSASVNFDPTMGTIHVTKDISVNGNNLPGGFATVSGVTNQFSEVPLPPSVLLLGSSLLGLVGFRRFKKS
jgi:hypothetical protein